MTALDCDSPDGALRSLAALLRIEPKQLRSLLLAATLDADFEARLLREPYEAVVWSRLGLSDLSLAAPTEIAWYHGSRLAPGTSFALGLLPLSQCIDALRSVVDRIADDLAIPQGSGFSNPSYCLKVASLNEQGPCASLLRDAVVRPAGAHRDFLASPEIVEDLAQARAGDRFGDIIDVYQKLARPCVVSFRSRTVRTDVVYRALAYCHSHIQGLDEPIHWNTCFDGRGVAVPPEDIVQVEWLAG